MIKVEEQAPTSQTDDGKGGFNPRKARPDVAGIRKTKVIVVGLIMVLGWGFNSGARGQSSIAFVPDIGSIPTGETLTVTPAVSADRRYVRLTVDAFFNGLLGFTTINIPGAVSGGFGGGGGVGGGLGGGVGGGLGGGVGGGLGGAVGGGFGGMNGVIGQGGFGGAGSGMSAGASFRPGAEPLAGPVPFGAESGEFGPPHGDPLDPNTVAMASAQPEGAGPADQARGVAEPAPLTAGDGRAVRAANKHVPRQRRASPRRSSRRSSSTPPRPSD